jgi:hypothetical protein
MGVLARYGLVSLVVTIATLTILTVLPLSAPGSSWYWPTTATGLVVLLGLAAWSVRAMLLRASAPQRPATTRLPGRTLPAAAASTARVASVPPAPPRTPDLSQAPTEFSPRPSDASQAPTEFSPRPGAGPGPGGGLPPPAGQRPGA